MEFLSRNGNEYVVHCVMLVGVGKFRVLAGVEFSGVQGSGLFNISPMYFCTSHLLSYLYQPTAKSKQSFVGQQLTGRK